MAESKRNRLARYSRMAGLTAVLEKLSRQPGLAVLNYHRIGNPFSDPYDPAVFSARAEDFEAQVRLIQARHRIATLADAIEWLGKPGQPTDSLVLFTFDDGYLDNYQLAFPILRANRASAVFFLVTDLVDRPALTWWDRIAYIVHTAAPGRYRLNYPAGLEFELASDRAAVRRRLLSLYYGSFVAEPNRYLAALEEATRIHPPEESGMLLNWSQAAEMAAGGMDIGSHTCSHPILGRLPAAEQLDELVRSRQTLEARLGRPVLSVAYPVGMPGTYNSDTMAAARTAGYQAGFSFHGGFNRPGRTDRFSIQRMGVEHSVGMDLFRLRMASVAFAGKTWF